MVRIWLMTIAVVLALGAVGGLLYGGPGGSRMSVTFLGDTVVKAPASTPQSRAALRAGALLPPSPKETPDAVMPRSEGSGRWVLTAAMTADVGLDLSRMRLPGLIDYSDPVGEGAVPLMRVRGMEETMLSEHFRIRDFAARGGAAYARISYALVDTLELLQAFLGRSLHITSGYRHQALNFSPEIRGAAESQHIAGVAADLWVDGRTPLEVAEAALQLLGCEIGLGLGDTFVHLDLRGHQASWATEGAAMDEAAFDLWVLERCEDAQESGAEGAGGCAVPASGLTRAAAHRDEMTALALVHRRRAESGAVVLDLRAGVPGRDVSLPYALSFAPPASALARSLELVPMLARAEANNSFVFVTIGPDGNHDVGFMGYDARESGAASAPAEGACPPHVPLE